MTDTIFIHGGACNKGKEVIKKLLDENDYTNNVIKNKVICADAPNKVYEIEEFLGSDEFTFLPMIPDSPIDISTNITKVMIVQKDGIND